MSYIRCLLKSVFNEILIFILRKKQAGYFGGEKVHCQLRINSKKSWSQLKI